MQIVYMQAEIPNYIHSLPKCGLVSTFICGSIEPSWQKAICMWLQKSQRERGRWLSHTNSLQI